MKHSKHTCMHRFIPSEYHRDITEHYIKVYICTYTHTVRNCLLTLPSVLTHLLVTKLITTELTQHFTHYNTRHLTFYPHHCRVDEEITSLIKHYTIKKTNINKLFSSYSSIAIGTYICSMKLKEYITKNLHKANTRF